MSNRADEPAFPVTSAAEHQYCGVSSRDYFAAKALQGFLSNPMWQGSDEDFAKMAYEQADAMLAERAK